MNLKKLKIEEVKCYKIDAFDLNDLIKSTYNIEYEFIATQEAGNDSDYTFEVESEEIEVDEDTMPYEVLNDLAFKKIIPEGNYLVRVCW